VESGASHASREEWQTIDDLYPSLRRFAAVTAPSDMEPDDLLQEALVKVLSRRSLSDLNHPDAYIRRTILNVAASHYRRMGRQRAALARIRASDTGVVDADYPSDLAELFRLPPKERATLYLAEVEGYHFDEIAKLLDCSAPAARKAASRARRRLRLELTTGSIE